MGDSQMISLLYVVGLFALLYFLMIRPQQQRQKKHQAMVSSLKPNEKVVTIGGIYGTIIKIKEDSLILKIAENVRIELQKSAISQVLSKEDEENDEG